MGNLATAPRWAPIPGHYPSRPPVRRPIPRPIMSRPSFGAPHFERRGSGCSTLAAAICTAGGGLGDGFMLGGGSSPDCSRWGPPLGFQTPPPWSSGPEMTSANRPPPPTTPLPMLPEERLWLFEFPPPPPPPQHSPPHHDVYYFPPHEHYCPPPHEPSAPSHGGPCIYHQPPSHWWSSNEFGDGDILFHLQPPRDPMPPPPPPSPPPPHLLPAPPWGSAWEWSTSGMVQEPYESMPISAMEDSDADDDMMFRVERDAPSAPPQPPSSSLLQRNKPPPQSGIGDRDSACSTRRRSARGGLTSSPTNDSLGFPDEPPTRDCGPAPPSADPWTLRPRAERPEEDDGQSRAQAPINITTLFRGCVDKTSDSMAGRCKCSGDMRCGGDTTARCTCGNSGGDPGARMSNITGDAGAGEGCTTRPTECLPAAAAGATTTATTTTLTTAASALTSSVASSPSPAVPLSTAATTSSSAPASTSTLNYPPSATLPRKMTLSHGRGYRSVPAEQARAKARLCMRTL